MTALCRTCTRPDPTNGVVCPTCAQHARRDLATIADITPAARAAVYGQASRGPTIGGHSDTPRLQLNLAAAARLDAVQTELTGLVRLILGDRGGTPPTGDLIAGCATWLTGHVEWLRHRIEPDPHEAYATIHACLRVLLGVVNGPGERQWLGRCGAPAGAGECQADLYARGDATHVACRECGARHNAADLRTWLYRLVREYSYTTAEITAAYPWIRAGTIRQWVHRGRLTPTGHDRDGMPLYRLGAVLDLAARRGMQEGEGGVKISTRRRVRAA